MKIVIQKSVVGANTLFSKTFCRLYDEDRKKIIAQTWQDEEAADLIAESVNLHARLLKTGLLEHVLRMVEQRESGLNNLANTSAQANP